jgi:hypothetical protein
MVLGLHGYSIREGVYSAASDAWQSSRCGRIVANDLDQLFPWSALCGECDQPAASAGRCSSLPRVSAGSAGDLIERPLSAVVAGRDSAGWLACGGSLRRTKRPVGMLAASRSVAACCKQGATLHVVHVLLLSACLPVTIWLLLNDMLHPAAGSRPPPGGRRSAQQVFAGVGGSLADHRRAVRLGGRNRSGRPRRNAPQAPGGAEAPPH